MSLLRTLICTQGQDSPIRLVAIQFGILAVLMTAAGLFYNTSLAQSGSAFIVLLFIPIAWLSGKRRLHQAVRPQGLAWLLAVSWLLVAVFLIALPSYAWWTLILPVATTVALAALPSKTSGTNGHWGYIGPANFSNSALARSRVEPSIAGEATEAPAQTDWDDYPSGKVSLPSFNFSNASETVKRYWLPLSAASCVVVVIAILVAALSSDDADSTDGTNLASDGVGKGGIDGATDAKSTPKFDALVSLPDSFQVALQQQTLVITWPGDAAKKGELWSQLKASGDKSCTYAEFNNGDKFRPISVDVMADDIYYAYFSALDTKAMVYNVAMRGDFSLCGYRFSLNGTMKPLKADPEFAPYLTR